MAKQDVKSYVLSRARTLIKEIAKHKGGEENTELKSAEDRLSEVKNMASNFGVKTKEIEKIEQEYL